MVESLVGMIAGATFLLFLCYAKKNDLQISWWKWIIIISGFSYAVFTIEVIAALLKEGTTKGAIVVGVVMGFSAILWGVVINRFLLPKPTKRES